MGNDSILNSKDIINFIFVISKKLIFIITKENNNKHCIELHFEYYRII